MHEKRTWGERRAEKGSSPSILYESRIERTISFFNPHSASLEQRKQQITQASTHTAGGISVRRVDTRVTRLVFGGGINYNKNLRIAVLTKA